MSLPELSFFALTSTSLNVWAFTKFLRAKIWICDIVRGWCEKARNDNSNNDCQNICYVYLCFVVHIPAPIVFGQLFDSFCIEWNSSCGEKGSCALYNIETMRYTLTSIEVGSRLLVFILYIFIFYAAKRDDAKNHNSSTKYDIELKAESPTSTI